MLWDVKTKEINYQVLAWSFKNSLEGVPCVETSQAMPKLYCK